MKKNWKTKSRNWKSNWKKKLGSLLLAVYPITVSAAIGEPRLTIFGYSSPQAYIELQGQQVSDSAISDSQGYFVFDRILLPFAKPGYPELCLSVIDRKSRTSAFPTCLPPLPEGSFDINVGPVLLPPTITLGKGTFSSQDQVAAQGSTLPDSKVIISLTNDSINKKISLIPQAYAYHLPSFEIQSQSDGSFDFNLPQLPSQILDQSQWRVFASAEYNGAPTPKSNTLTFEVRGKLSWWLDQIRKLFISLLGRLKLDSGLVILLEILFILVLISGRKSSLFGAKSGRPPEPE